MSSFADYVDEAGVSRLRAISPLLVARVHVSAADILAIGDGTNRVLVPAPNSSTVLVPLLIAFSYRGGSVAYDYDPSLLVTWSSYVARTFDLTGGSVINDVVDAATIQSFGTPLSFFTDSGAADSPRGEALVLSATTIGPFSPPLGDGTIDMTIAYVAWSLLPV